MNLKILRISMDCFQVSHALKHGGKQSLLLIDEFGKGTAPVDGMALLMGVISNLVERKDEAPFALFSSHYHEVFFLHRYKYSEQK